MALKPNESQSPYVRQHEAPGEWRLILAPKPKARVHLYLTIPPEANGGVQVQKYSTRFGQVFEKHTTLNGIETWWKLVKVGES